MFEKGYLRFSLYNSKSVLTPYDNKSDSDVTRTRLRNVIFSLGQKEELGLMINCPQ